MAAYTVSRLLAAGSTNATLVQAAPGTVTGWQLFNAAAYAVYFKLYDSATIPTAGSGTPKITIGVPAGVANSISLGSSPVEGIRFTNGIGFTMTKLPADADATALVANDLIANLFYC